MLSTIGTARGRTQASWRPLPVSSVFSPPAVTVSWAVMIVAVGLMATRKTMFSPLEMPPWMPPERLLEFDVRQGWQPLCAFLDRPVPPDTPFPRLNDRRWFRRVLLTLRLAEWLVPALLLAVAAWLVSGLR